MNDQRRPMHHALERLDPRTARAEAERSHPASFRQTWGYAEEAASRVRAASEWWRIRLDGEVSALVNVRVRTLGARFGGIALVSGGPTITSARDSREQSVQTLVAIADTLRAEYCVRRGHLLRFEISPLSYAGMEWELGEAFAQGGFTRSPAVRPYRTAIRRVDESDAEIRGTLDQKWRNQLNSAMKKGLTADIGTSDRHFDEASRIIDATSERKGFRLGMTPQFFRSVRDRDSTAKASPVIILIQAGEEPCAAHIGIYAGAAAVYLLGGTTELGRSNKSAYLAQWHAMLLARDRGCTYYDTGGIDPVANPGVYHFKRGMAPIECVAPGPFDAKPRGLRGFISSSADRLSHILRFAQVAIQRTSA